MTIKALYPVIEPTLELDFANTKTLDPRISFTRASTGTYVGADGLIKTAGNGVARFDHSATGESLGLLVEEERTNEHLNSTINAVTSIVGIVQGSASIINPTGATSTVESWTQDTSTGSHWGYQFYSNDTVAYGYSLFVKPNGTTKILVSTNTRDSDPGISVDLTTGQVFAGASSNYLISKLANGWVRISVITPSMRAHGPGFRLLNASGNSSFTGDGTSGVYVWGMQFERGSFSTSYIPTSGSTVTRAADTASITGTNFSSWFNRNNGTLLCNAQNLGADPNPPLILTATPYYQGAGGYKLGLSGFWSNVTQLSTDAWVNGVSLGGSAVNVSETQAASATIRHSFAYSPTECKACVKQTLGVIGGSQCFQAAQGLDRLLFQQYFGGTSSRINRIAFYPVRLPDAQLQALTAT